VQIDEHQIIQEVEVEVEVEVDELVEIE